MERSEILQKVEKVFRDVFFDDSITIKDDTTSKDIEGWESLTHISLISSIEDEFNIKFNTKEVINMQNVGDMIDCIIEKIK